jgi:hypothetical protein
LSIRDTTSSTLRSAFETLVLSAGGPLAGMTLRPSDPLWLQAGLPWLMLAPFLCGAQYGVMHGVASGLLLSALAFAHGSQVAALSWQVISHWSLGCLIVGALAGQFRDVGERRRAALREQVAQLMEAAQRAQRAAHTFKLSHTRLEERLAASRWSLAGSLEAAARRMQELSSRRALGEVLLEVLASQAMLQSASLFWTGPNALLPAPIASLGPVRSTSHLHPLVLRAWKTRRLTAVGDPASASIGDVAVLAAVPLITSSGHIVGVVAIHQLPFMAFQTDQLRSLLVIAGQLADSMNDRLHELAKQGLVNPVRLSLPPSAAEPSQTKLRVPAPIGHGALGGQHSAVVVSRVFDVTR